MANTQPVIRSISLPSREHPCSVRIEALLKNLKSFQFEVPHGLNTIQTSLVALAELYSCVEELMNSPTTQQQRANNAKPLLEQALEDSIALIDTCSVARDTLLSVDEHVQAIQSALRRKGGGDSSVIEANVHAYVRFRKKAKKGIIAKCLGELKRLEINNNNNMAINDNCQYHVLRETSSITASVFRCLLKLLSQPPSTSAKTNNSGWSLVSKLMMRKRMLSLDNNLVADVDASLYSLLGNLHSNEAVTVSQKMLETLNSSSENIISGLDFMFRCLVKNRVSLLNVLTH